MLASTVNIQKWQYFGGIKQALTGDAFITLPSKCDIVEIRAVGGPVLWAIGPAGALATNGPGYVPEDQAEIIGPMVEWEYGPRKQGLALYGTGTAYLVFFRQVPTGGATK